MLFLDSTTRKLQLTTSSTSAIDVVADWVDITSTTYAAGCTPAAITTATTTDIVAAPAATTTRQVKSITCRNKGAASNILTVILDDSGTDYVRFSATLPPGETLTYTDADGWRLHDSAGRGRVAPAEATPLDGYASSMLKVGATSEAAGLIHTLALVAGSPGAWAPGTPGMAGRATDGTAAADAGCLQLKTPGAGANYLTGWSASCTTAHAPLLLDVIWVQSGITVTTTTAQTINSVAWPARDLLATTDGDGVQVGILVSAATGNAGAVTNTTLTYTNEAGTGSRTATMASFPATCAAGAIIPFVLQAGDLGIRSVQSVTLGTTYTSGTIHLVAYRIIAQIAQTLANIGANADLGRGVSLPAGSCLLPAYLASATTGTTLTCTATLEVR